MVPAEIIDQVRQAVRILDVIGGTVELRKSGRNHVGLCPFHAEKSPSFSVNAEKNLYHCFGCQAGGDAFDFLMRQQGLDFHDAVLQLGQRVGIEVEAPSPQKLQQRQHDARLIALNTCALRFFSLALLHPCGAAARQALTERGAPAAQAKARQLGYGHTTAAFLAYIKRQGFSVDEAQEAGLLSEDSSHLLFERRLIFPIYSVGGQVVGFGGRKLTQGGNAPKYINSKETSIFSKRRLLYGLYEAHAAIRQRKQVVIMEGYTDVLTAQRSGIDTAVAVLGTAFTPEHAKALQRLCSRAVLCFDADRAGRSAAFKSSQVALQAGMQAHIAALPAGEDPDSLARRLGAVALQQRIDAAPAAMAYFLDDAFADAANMSIEQKAQAAHCLGPLLQALGSGLERDLYTERLAQRVGVSVQQLQQAVKQQAPPAPRPAPTSQRPAPRLSEAATSEPAGAAAPPAAQQAQPQPYELELLRELLLFPALRAHFGEIADYAVSDAMRYMMEELASTQTPWQDVLTRHLRPGPQLSKLLRIQPKGATDPTKNPGTDDLGGDEAASRHTLSAVLASLKRHRLDVALRELVQEIRRCEAAGEATVRLIRRKQELTQRKRALKQQCLPQGSAQTMPSAAPENVQGE